mmetsp:Transcript_27600/g.60380  ORF Transcript_27600/g.60380 Transcript_27600/m.60380 type:complete len:448 (+) Transcript_27600:355-1698(+)|eukprot:CAMPEP_0202890570 /NCGR_PEP_ID=MMETSP1392-20130828/930_1 /ASSEMBLY_ACC=CAM_ASM_000868 /TAXON_ID=225041 /ORGANISM="Chlamydomonas chlamydogama, Strain SAG 11-48b" /LENGTH=447 /DNA_ID=CAMNT_0049574167 /DNA_START=348 /DNA_END=1691 /DNA_ORIENTATION=+
MELSVRLLEQPSCLAVLLLLLVGATTIQAMGPGAAHGPHAHGHHGRRSSQVPSCKKLLANLQEPQFAMLRDASQVYAQYQRRVQTGSIMLHHKRHPPTDIGKQYAYNTSKTEDQLQKELQDAEAAKANVMKKLGDMVEGMKRSGALPNEAPVRLVQRCVYGRLNTHLYEYRPRLSLMMQYFKRPWIIHKYIQQLQKCHAEVPLELVVNVDHPRDHEAWAWSSYNTSGMVVPVFSNNIHEVRSYNRLAHIARGDILIMIADDDYPPESCDWLHNVVKIFDRWPEAGIVGIRNYVTCFDLDHGNRGEWFQDPQIGLTLQFVEKVDMAPLAVRRSAYMHVGGMDEGTTEPGECGILTDWDLCLRMWVAGWQVLATKQVHMQHDHETGGTHRPETAERCWGKQQGIAGSVMQTHIDIELEREICLLARELTLKNLQPYDQNKCPYKEGCKL